jgi:phage terminase large subunit
MDFQPRPVTNQVNPAVIAAVNSVRDPKLFFNKYLNVELWRTQAAILDAVVKHPRVAIKACHASSKTYSAARLAIWFLARYTEAVVITTAPTWNQVEQLLWGEIHSALIKSSFPFTDDNGRKVKANLTEFKLGPKRLAYGLSTAVTNQDEGVRIQGIHAENVLVIMDEAPGINPKIWEAIEGARAGGNVRIIALGNPTVASGPFHSAFVDERYGWKCFTIDGFNTPNFDDIPGHVEKVDSDGKIVGLTTEKGEVVEGSKLWHLLNTVSDEELDNNVCPYLITRRWVKEKFYEWGPDHPSWQSRVRGQFPTQSSDALISLAWLEAQKTKNIPEKNTDEIVAGLDVAGPGDDETSLTIRKGSKIFFHKQWPHEDPRGEVVAALAPYKNVLKSVNVDTIGIGEGMYRHLSDLKFPVNPVNVCERSNEPEQFANIKSEYYWGLRLRLQQGDFCGLEDEKTIGQLAGIRYKQNPRGQTEIESKDDARKRGVKSPDRAESIMLAFGSVAKVYGVLSYFKEAEKEMNKTQSSILMKPGVSDKQLACEQCSATCVVPKGNGWRCNQCGHTWGIDKKQIPTFTRTDYLAKLGRS